MLAASFGLALLVLSINLSIFLLPPSSGVLNALSTFGAFVMTAGYMLVMWSRLHIVMPPGKKRLSDALLIMIIVANIGIFTPETAGAVLRSTGHASMGMTLGKVGLYLQMYACAAANFLLVGCYIYFLHQYAKHLPPYAPIEIHYAVKRTYTVLIAVSVALIIDKIVLTILLIMNLMLVRMVAMAVMLPICLSLELVFIRELVHLSKAKSNLLAKGNVCLSFGSGSESSDGQPPGRTSEPRDDSDFTRDDQSGVLTCDLGESSAGAGPHRSETGASRSEEKNTGMTDHKARAQIIVHHDSLEDLERQYLGKIAEKW